MLVFSPIVFRLAAYVFCISALRKAGAAVKPVPGVAALSRCSLNQFITALRTYQHVFGRFRLLRISGFFAGFRGFRFILIINAFYVRGLCRRIDIRKRLQLRVYGVYPLFGQRIADGFPDGTDRGVYPVAFNNLNVLTLDHYFFQFAPLGEDYKRKKRYFFSEIPPQPLDVSSVLPDRVVKTVLLLVRKHGCPFNGVFVAEYPPE